MGTKSSKEAKLTKDDLEFLVKTTGHNEETLKEDNFIPNQLPIQIKKQINRLQVTEVKDNNLNQIS